MQPAHFTRGKLQQQARPTPKMDQETLLSKLRREKSSDSSLQFWKSNTDLDEIEVGKLFTLAAEKALSEDASDYYSKIQLHRDGLLIDVPALAASNDVELSDQTLSRLEVIGCAFCIAFNWTRSSAQPDDERRPRLRRLCLARNALSEKDMECFLIAITGTNGTSHCSQLLTLADENSANFRFTGRIPGMEKGEHGSGSLLQDIDFSNNSLQQLHTQLSSVITWNSRLGSLILSCASLGGVAGLLKFVGNPPRLGIGDSFAQKKLGFAEEIKNSRLTHLDVSGNGLGMPAVKSLVNLLKDGTCPLTHLNLAYNAFDPSDRQMRDLITKPSKFQDKDSEEDSEEAPTQKERLDHPIVMLFCEGLIENTSLLCLDLTGSFRFGVVNPQRSCDPDDWTLDGTMRERIRFNKGKAEMLHKIVFEALKDALRKNGSLEHIWLGETELTNPELEDLQQSAQEEARADSELSSGGLKRKRHPLEVHGGKRGDAAHAVKYWYKSDVSSQGTAKCARYE